MWNSMDVTDSLSFDNQNTYFATFENIKFTLTRLFLNLKIPKPFYGKYSFSWQVVLVEKMKICLPIQAKDLNLSKIPICYTFNGALVCFPFSQGST